MIRMLLGGNLENTAFCLLSPDGTERLSRSGRGFTRDVNGAAGLDRVALEYRAKGELIDSLTPDFNSFRMALNTASADSRVLVLVSAPEDQITVAEEQMRQVAWHDDIVGRCHFDLETNAKQFTKPLSLAETDEAAGIYIIQPGTFGVDGTVMQRLPLDTDASVVIESLTSANEQYAKVTERKTYSEHVAEGKRLGYYFEMKMEFGEDRDGDGKVDGRSSRRYESQIERAFQTGNYFPDVSQAK